MPATANDSAFPRRTAWIIGATGLVGRHLLAQLAQDDAYTHVVALVRRPFDTGSPKIECRVIDFDRLESMKLDRVDDAFCALGTTIKKAGSQSAFFQVDFTYTVAFAKMAVEHGGKRLCLVSSGGANPRSRTFYLHVKGEVENVVSKLGFDETHIFRPSLLEGERTEFRFGERVALSLMRALNLVLPRRYRSVPADAVARCMIAAAKSGQRGTFVHESDAIQNYRRD